MKAEVSTVKSVAEVTRTGYMADFQIAALHSLNMQNEEDKAVLNTILEECPQDDLWDDSFAFEKAMKRMGKKRFHYTDQSMTSTTLRTDDLKSVSLNGYSAKKRKADSVDMANPLASGASGSDQPPVAVLFPKHVEACRLNKVLETSLPKIAEIQGELKKKKAELATIPGDHASHTEHINTILAALSDGEDAIMTVNCVLNSMEKDNDPELTNLIARNEKLIEHIAATLDAGKERAKKISSYIASL